MAALVEASCWCPPEVAEVQTEWQAGGSSSVLLNSSSWLQRLIIKRLVDFEQSLGFLGSVLGFKTAVAAFESCFAPNRVSEAD